MYFILLCACKRSQVAESKDLTNCRTQFLEYLFFMVQKMYPWHCSLNLCVSDLQLDENVHVLRKRIEPDAPVISTPAPPAPPLPEPTPMEEDGVSLVSPTSAVPPPPLPEGQNEGEQAEQQEGHQEEQKQPPPPTGSEELLTPAEPPQDSTTGKQGFFLIKLISRRSPSLTVFMYYYCNMTI